jgi:hypothetical protein
VTPEGQELRPVVDALRWWGLRHAWRWPKPGEPLHVEHLLGAVTQAIDKTSDDHNPARWHLHFPDEDHDQDYLVECDGDGWSLALTDPQVRAEVTVTATVPAFIEFLFARSSASEPGIDVAGDTAAVQRFGRLVAAVADVVGRP